MALPLLLLLPARLLLLLPPASSGAAGFKPAGSGRSSSAVCAKKQTGRLQRTPFSHMLVL
jgi:hypothetical protein